jgi:radical SAM superfamily enzyme YgiQ (UPF0313 family)
MDVLLIAPPRQVPQRADFPPVGLAYIAAFLKREGVDAHVLDASAFPWTQLTKILKEKSPSIVGITCWTQERGQSFRMARLVRDVLPHAKVIFGGHHASALPRQIFARFSADAVVIGEGEQTMLELVRAMLDRKDLETVKGIGYRRDDAVVITEPREFTADLDKFPYPSYSDFDLDDYLGIPDLEGKAASLMTSRGCPYQCVFCSAGSFWKRRWRPRSPENVLGELSFLYHEHNVRNFSFFDDNFMVKKERAIDICKGIIARKLDIRWVASSHVAHIDEDLLEWMRKSGCFRIDFGIESGSPKVLHHMKKGQTVAQIERTFGLVHASGIHPRAYLIVGCPGETKETIDETLSLMKKIRPYDSRTAEIILVFPGTQLYESALTQGMMTEDDWARTDETPHYTCEHTFEELKVLKDRLMKGMARNKGTALAAFEYLARKAYYRYPSLQKLRKFRRIFKG